MKIKKGSLEALFNFIKGTEGVLTLVESRHRDSFLKPLIVHFEDFIKHREEIYAKFALKKEDGSIHFINGNQLQVPRENIEELNKEIDIIRAEEVDLDFSDNPSQIKAILEKSEYKPKVGEVELFDEILNAI